MKRAETRRSAKLGEEIMREVAMILSEEVADPRLDLVTVSGVRLNVDMSVAEILYTAQGDESHLADVAKALERARGFVKGRLGKRLKLRFVPDLRFRQDDFLEHMVYGRHDEPQA